MKSRIFLFGGAAAPLFYLGGLGLGGLISPGYNPIHQAVSELIAVGAPCKPVLDVLFSICALLVLFSSLGLQQFTAGSQNRLGRLAARAGSWTLAGISLVGLVVLAFPMDSPGSFRTPAGLVHTACSCLMCAISLPAVMLITYWLFSQPGNKNLARYSAATAAILFLFGSASAVVYFSQAAFLGLLERLTFITFFQWLAVLTISLARSWREEGAGESDKRRFKIPACREKSANTL